MRSARLLPVLIGIVVTACPEVTPSSACNTDTDCDENEWCPSGVCVPLEEPEPDVGGDGDGDATGDGDGDTPGDGDGDAPGDGDGDGDTVGDGDGDVDGGAALDAGPIDAGPLVCPENEHNGGDDVCVPLDACSPGFAFLFPDADADGVGAGDPGADCVPEGGAPGWSTLDTDCAPDDSLAWEEVLAWIDLDGDGFSSYQDVLCIGDGLPQGATLGLVAPPFVSLESTDGDNVNIPQGDSWDGPDDIGLPDQNSTVCYLEPNILGDDVSDLLYVHEFDLPIPDDAAIQGVAVHVLRRSQLLNGDAISDLSVRLVTDDVNTPVGEERANLGVPWATDWEEVVYGGPTDTWGAVLTPADIKQLSFGFTLQVSATGMAGLGGTNAYVDHVWIEVFTDSGTDCDDDNPDVWSTRRVAADNDLDGYSQNGSFPICVGTSLPPGLRELDLGIDCYDDNPDARPGQTAYFRYDRGDGSHDYNCDGNISKQTLSGDANCSCDAVNGVCSSAGTVNYQNPSGSCGSLFNVGDCPGTCVDACSPGTAQQRILCR